MNPYEVSQITSEAIQSLLDATDSFTTTNTDVLKDRLQQLQQVHSRSWHLLRQNEHADFLMARLESMDVLCGRLLPVMESGSHISNKQLARSQSLRSQTSKYLAKSHSLRSQTSKYRLLRSRSCCVSFPRDQLGDIVAAVSEELQIWLDYQDGISELLACQAFGVFPRLQALALEGYRPVPELTRRVLEALLSPSIRAVVLSGPSGVGKSSLATYVASNPPEFLSDGAAEVNFGSYCTLARGRDAYERSLLAKLRLLLHDLNSQHKVESLPQAWTAVENALEGSAYLIVLDDAWEKELVDHFMQLKKHSCKFLVTCREEPVYTSGSVSSIVLGLKDVAGVAQDVLAFHCGVVDRDGLPRTVAPKLLKCCGYHPLTVSILGEALRGTWRSEEWNAVLTHLQQPSRPSLGSEKHANFLYGVFSSIELSVIGMQLEVQSFFHALASLSWAEMVPADCLKALWSIVGDGSGMLLQTRELVRRSLLRRSSDFNFYGLHDLVIVYLERKVRQSVEVLLKFSQPESKAVVAPWLLHYGNAESKVAAAGVLEGIFLHENEELHGKTLGSMVDVVSSCSNGSKNITREEFNRLVGPAVVNLLVRATSLTTYAAIIKYISTCFTVVEYVEYGTGLVASGISSKLKLLLSNNVDLGGSVGVLVKNDAVEVLGKLASTRDSYVVRSLVESDLVHDLVLLLDAKSGWIHEGVVTAIVKLAENREITMEEILQTDMVEKLFALLQSRKHAVKCRALNMLFLLIPAGGSRLLSRILDRGLMEELNLLLNCPSEDVRTNASVLCQLLCVIAQESTVCMDGLLKTELVETLTSLLNDEVEKSRTSAVVCLRSLVQSRGRSVAERVLRAAGLENIQKGMDNPGLQNAGYKAYKHLMNSLCENK